MTALIPTTTELWDGATLPTVYCDPCDTGNHPDDGNCPWVAALDTAGDLHAMACDCEPCRLEYNRRFWAAVKAS